MPLASTLVGGFVLSLAVSNGVSASPLGGENPPTFDGLFLPYGQETLNGKFKHAVVLSNDGMHEFDFVDYVNANPQSTLAQLSKQAVIYGKARASKPSDSYPATAAIWAGVTPRTSGIYWDDTYARDLYPPASNCQGPMGTEVDLSSTPDLNGTDITGGNAFNLSALPMRKTEWGQCAIVYPHDYIRTNTLFEVARSNGLYTAYADKHPTYEFLNGPSGLGLSESYFPEIGSFKHTDTAQESWDDLHWNALTQWAQGNFHNGTKNPAGVPGVFGANFQALTNAQSTSGYVDGTGKPTANVTSVLQHYDQKLGEFVETLKKQGIWEQTLLIVGSKQGQGPIDPKSVKLVDPALLEKITGVPVSFTTSADGALMWLQNSADANTAKKNLLAADKNQTGISYVYAGDEVWQYGFGSPALDARAPDLIIGATEGVLFMTDNTLEDHGGNGPDDINVPLLAVSGGNLKSAGKNITVEVQNRQIAPTVLHALGLPLYQLDGHRIEGTPVLPGLF